MPAASKNIYNVLFQLINEQSPQSRKTDAVSRFKYFMSEKDKLNIIAAYQEDIIRHQEKYKKLDKFYPFAGEINKYLSDSDAYVTGVKELLTESGRKDWQSEFELFKTEIEKYNNFVKENILPFARQTPNYPRELYKLALKKVGVDAEPEDLITAGKKHYKRIYKDYSKLAKSLAKKYKLSETDPASVLGYLKSKQVASIEDVCQFAGKVHQQFAD